jgi:type II secretory pathway pseudopilin PulG
MDIPPQIPSDQIPPPNFHTSPQVQPKSNFPTGIVIGAVVVIGFCFCLPIAGAILFPVFAQAKDAARRTQAISNLKLAATAVIVYTADYDDRFPPTMGENRALTQSLSPYLKSQNVMVIEDTPIDGNPNLASKKSTDVEFPQSTIMLYCIPEAIRNSAFVAATDGSAKRVEPNDLLINISNNTFTVPSK